MGRDGETRALVPERLDARLRLVVLEASEEIGTLLGEHGGTLLGPPRDPLVARVAPRLDAVDVHRVLAASKTRSDALLVLLGLLPLAIEHGPGALVEVAVPALPDGLAELLIGPRVDVEDDVGRDLTLAALARHLLDAPLAPEIRVARFEVLRDVEVGAVLGVLLVARFAHAYSAAVDEQGCGPAARVGVATAVALGLDAAVLEVGSAKVEAVAWKGHAPVSSRIFVTLKDVSGIGAQ